MQYIVTAERPPTERLGPICRCIYCGVTRAEAKLTREHVLADGLGGWIVLDQASCRPCADKINPFETTVIRNNFGLVRAAKGIRSKKPRSKARRTQDLIYRVGPGKEQTVPIGTGMPHTAILHHFGKFKRATILTGEDPRSRTHEVSFSRLDTLLPRLNHPTKFTLPPVSPLPFYRFLAKTAHCAAFCAAPWGGFKSFLMNLILDGRAEDAPMYIGTIDEVIQPSDDVLHVIEVNTVEADAYFPMLGSVRKTLLVAKINFFVNHCSHPTYEVIVGEPDSSTTRILPIESKIRPYEKRPRSPRSASSR